MAELMSEGWRTWIALDKISTHLLDPGLDIALHKHHYRKSGRL